jgi:hypothetical protein
MRALGRWDFTALTTANSVDVFPAPTTMLLLTTGRGYMPDLKKKPARDGIDHHVRTGAVVVFKGGRCLGCVTHTYTHTHLHTNW